MKTRRHLAPLALCAFICCGLAACSATRTTYLADGGRGYAVGCKGYLNNWQACLVKAGAICKSRGYRTIAADEYDRTMIIACNETTAAK